MQSSDSLPGDQRAVLQLVLGRGRSYDQIARMLSINPDAVRERAHAALSALGPQTRVSDDDRALIGDYLLGQLAEDRIPRARELLASSAPERAWARVVSSELTPLASNPLPEIPLDAGGARPAAAPDATGTPGPSTPGRGNEPAWGADDAADEAESTPASGRALSGGAASRIAAVVGAGSAAEEAGADAGGSRRGRPRRGRGRGGVGDGSPAAGSRGGAAGAPRASRTGGALVILVAVIVVAVVLFLVLGGGSSTPHKVASAPKSASTPAPTASTTSTAAGGASGSSTATTSASTSGAKVLAQINLTPPSGASSKAAGIAEILSEGSTDGIAIVAQGVPANSTKPPNAYAVWLYNSPTDAHILGFVNPGVGSTGRFSTATALPANASHYKQLIVTVETTGQPKTPGTVILQGALKGL
jgi:hypothetical protein